MQFVETDEGTVKFEIVKLAPCKFVGKSVYAREHGRETGGIFKYCRENFGWVFDELDTLNEYATGEVHNTALKTWDCYFGESRTCFDMVFSQSCMVGYHVGRFMKADCPVPEDMDAIEMPEIHIAKGWLQSDPPDAVFHKPKLIPLYTAMEEEAGRQGFDLTSWILMADVFPAPDANGAALYGQYSSCTPKPV